jgi:fumarate hydratase class I
MIDIKLPIAPEDIRKLKAGDEVSISGVMITARDAAHKYLVETDGEDVKELLRDSMIYHCGPVVRKEKGVYSFVAAGPTTSIREEPYEATVIEKYGVRGVIGKGGMGATTLAACEKHGCVYLSAVGGLATILARSVVEVKGVHKLEEFGVPEAMWVIRVDGFPAVVTMDSHRAVDGQGRISTRLTGSSLLSQGHGTLARHRDS